MKKETVSMETLISLRDRFGLGTSRGNSYQNMINERKGVKKRHKVLGVPNETQMAIASKMKSEIVASVKNQPIEKATASVLSSGIENEIKTVLGKKMITGVKPDAVKKTKHKKPLKNLLAGD